MTKARWWARAVAAVAVAATVTSCAGSGSPDGQAAERSLSPRNTTTPARSTSTPPGATTAAAPAATAHPSPGGARQRDAQNLRVNSDLRAQLVRVWTGAQHLSAADVTGTKPGSVYYALVPSTNTYWAYADFTPSAGAIAKSRTAVNGGPLVQFQDGPWIFSRRSGGAWTLVTDTGGFGPCPGQVPASVFTVWALPHPAECSGTVGPGVDRFVQVISAVDRGKATVVTGYAATRVTGGPDEMHYQVTHQSVTLTADHRTMVELLAPSGAPPSHLLDARELPQALSRDHSGRIFDVTGTDQHITGLREMYHP